MDVREKLVEQLREVASKTPPICRYDNPDEIEHFGKTITVYCKPFEQFQELMRDAADCIAHSVTVQEWISASEPPKKITNKVIVLCKNGYMGYGHYEDYKGEQTWYNLESGKPFTDWDLEDCESYEVTHWMPLPQPPKGE